MNGDVLLYILEPKLPVKQYGKPVMADNILPVQLTRRYIKTIFPYLRILASLIPSLIVHLEVMFSIFKLLFNLLFLIKLFFKGQFQLTRNDYF